MKRLFACTLLLFAAAPSLAADANGYTAKYECRAGNPNCNVDVTALGKRACDQEIYANTAPTNNWSAINWSYDTICIHPGDHRGRGTLVIGGSGTTGNPKVIRYVRTSDNGDMPWKQSGANQAIVRDIECVGRSSVLVRRLTVLPDGGRRIFMTGCNDSIWDSILVDGKNVNNTNSLVMFHYQSGKNIRTTLQNSVVRNSGKANNTDIHCINFRGNDNRIVNNEIYNCGGDAIVMDVGSQPFMNKIENNDLYQTIDYYVNCDGTPATPGGNNHCNCGEDAIDLKSNDTTNPANGVEIVHNRMWGYRTTYQSCSGTGSHGFGVNSGSTDPKRYVQVKDNIIMDVANGISLSPPTSNWTVSGNIFYDVKHAHTPQDFPAASDGDNSVAVRFNGGSNHNVYLNTIARSEYALLLLSGAANNLLQCNVFFDLQATKRNASENWASTSIATNNAFYATAAFATTADNIIRPTTAEAMMSTYSFKRKLHTGPELTYMYSSRPSTSTPHYSGCQLTLN